MSPYPGEKKPLPPLVDGALTVVFGVVLAVPVGVMLLVALAPIFGWAP